jgi:hypothetical protein
MMTGNRLAYGVVGALLCATGVNGATISIGLQEAGVNGGAITTETTGTGAASITGVTYGTFTLNNVTALTLPAPGVLNSTQANVASGTAGTINVFVTLTGLTSPLGAANWTSSLTANALPAGWTVTESTFGSTSNTLYGTGFTLASNTFNAIGTLPPVTTTWPTGAGPYSVTEEYTITANTTPGATNNTIDLSGVAPAPGPVAGAGLPFLALGFGALWFGRRRKTKGLAADLPVSA